MDNYNYQLFSDRLVFIKNWIQNQTRQNIVVSLAFLIVIALVSILQIEIQHLQKTSQAWNEYHLHRANADLNYTYGHVQFSNNLSDRILENDKEIEALQVTNFEIKMKVDEHEQEIQGIHDFLEKQNAQNTSEFVENSTIAFQSCDEWARQGNTTSGMYFIDPDGMDNGVDEFMVHCKFDFTKYGSMANVKNWNGTYPTLRQLETMIMYYSYCKHWFLISLRDLKYKAIFWKDRYGTYVIDAFT